MGLYSNEQIEKAAQIDLVSYLHSKGERLVRVGSEYKLIYTDAWGEHDSVLIRGNKWYDHKNQDGGNTIKFLCAFYGMSFGEAMEDLLDGEEPKTGFILYRNSDVKKEKKKFVLPKKSKSIQKAFSYLTKERFLSPEIVNHFINRGVIYEEKRYGNVVFVGMDENAAPMSACQKNTKNDFRNTVEGSDKKYGFHHLGQGNRLYVFESAVDLMSYLTICPENWKEQSYIALDGMTHKAMLHFLEIYKHLNEIHICVDYDEAGIEAYDKFKDLLVEKGYESDKIVRELPICKDWNEMLKAANGIDPILPQLHPRMEEYNKQLKNLGILNSKTESDYMKWKTKGMENLNMKFLMEKIFDEFTALERNVLNIDERKYLSKEGERHAVRFSDLSLTAYCELQPKDDLIPKQTMYWNAINNLKEEYKPYKDKQGTTRRICDLKKEMDLVKTAYLNQEPSLSLHLNNVADTSMRLYVNNIINHLVIEQSIDNEQKQKSNLKEGEGICRENLCL